MTDDKKIPDRGSKAGEELEAEIEYREEDQALEDRAIEQDLNQGFDTGTHDSIRRGVNWPASYRVPTGSGKSEASPDPKKDTENNS